MIEQSSITNRLLWWHHYIPTSSSDCFLHQLSFSFDGAIASLFWPLLNGTKVIIPPMKALGDPITLAKITIHHQVTLLSGTPTMMSELMKEIAGFGQHSVRNISFVGESLSVKTAMMAFQLCDEVYNFYGPTESSIISTSFIVEKSIESMKKDRVPIGYPVANTQVYILDNTLRPVPIGVVGELFIGGEGLARGYLNRPELTNERFIDNPFATPEEKQQ